MKSSPRMVCNLPPGLVPLSASRQSEAEVPQAPAKRNAALHLYVCMPSTVPQWICSSSSGVAAEAIKTDTTLVISMRHLLSQGGWQLSCLLFELKSDTQRVKDGQDGPGSTGRTARGCQNKNKKGSGKPQG